MEDKDKCCTEPLAASTDEQMVEETYVDENCEQQLIECTKQLLVWKEKYAHAWADFDNFKRRSEKERSLLAQMGQVDLLKKLLPLVDDMERAFDDQQRYEFPQEVHAWLVGFSMIRSSLHKFLSDVGVHEMDVTTMFDPERHEAIMTVASDKQESGNIVAVLQKGYLYKDTVLRPAKVSVAE